VGVCVRIRSRADGDDVDGGGGGDGDIHGTGQHLDKFCLFVIILHSAAGGHGIYPVHISSPLLP